MEIRFLEPKDLDWVRVMYNAYFSDMEYPDFVNDFPVTYAVLEENDIVAVGGIRPIAEAVVITDASESVRKRRDALLQIFNALTYSANKLNFKRLYAFTFDDVYANHLTKVGFNPIKESKLLSLDL